MSEGSNQGFGSVGALKPTGAQPPTTFEQFMELVHEVDCLLSDLKGEIKLQGKNPFSLRSALLWLLGKKKNYQLSQKQLSMIYGITEVTLRNNAKVLDQFFLGLYVKKQAIAETLGKIEAKEETS